MRIYIPIIIVLLNSCSKNRVENSQITKVSLGSAISSEMGFIMNFKPVLEDSHLIGKWVFSEIWMGQMGLALEIKKDQTFEYWFMSDVKHDIKYPIRGKWSLVDGTLHLSAGDQILYSNIWVLVECNGVKGLMNPSDISGLVIGGVNPDSRFIKKLNMSESNILEWPTYNYPVTIDSDDLPK